jgi:hypothetical protein
MKRSTSALSRFTRSVSKLGARSHRRGASELPTIDAGLEEAAPPPPPPAVAADAAAGGAEAEVRAIAGAPGQLRGLSPTRRGSQPLRQPPGPGHDLIRGVPAMLALGAELSAVRAALRGVDAQADALRDATAAGAAAVGQEREGRGQAAAPPPAEGGWAAAEDGERWQRHLDACDAAVAEHRAAEALSQLRKLGRLADRAAAEGGAQELAWRLQDEAAARREALAAALERRIALPWATAGDAGAAARQLQEASSPLRALRALLAGASARLRRQLESVPGPVGATAGAAERAATEYAAELGQALSLGLDAALRSCTAALGVDSSAELSAALLGWALGEVVACCATLRRVALLPCAAPAGLRATLRCAAALLAHCDALGAAHGLPAAAAAQRELWPAVHQALQRRVRQLAEGVRRAAAAEAAAAAAADADSLPGVDAPWASLASVFPSADQMLGEVEAVAVAVAAAASPRAAAALRTGVTEVYAVKLLPAQQQRRTLEAYITCGAHTLPCPPAPPSLPPCRPTPARWRRPCAPRPPAAPPPSWQWRWPRGWRSGRCGRRRRRWRAQGGGPAATRPPCWNTCAAWARRWG